MTSDTKNIGYERLIVWQSADELAWAVYQITFNFPKEKLYGLTSQLRRAILSVVLNIVEGHARNSRKEFRHFLNISLGSLVESDYLLKFALRCKYLSKEDYDRLASLRSRCGKLLWNFMKSL